MGRKRILFTLFLTLFFATVVAPRVFAAQRVVDLTAQDGTKLKATYFGADKPGPGVLLLHQCNRQRKVWDGLAQQLATSGINVLTLDYRGFGESGGVRFDKATPQQVQELQTKWPNDIDLALQYLQSQPGVKRDTTRPLGIAARRYYRWNRAQVPWLEAWLDKQIQFDSVWENKVIERILHNMSLLMERSFASVQELNRFRKEVTAAVAAAAKGAGGPEAQPA